MQDVEASLDRLGEMHALVDCELRKLDDRVRMSFFVGYKYSGGGYRVWDLAKKVVESRDVVFFVDSLLSPPLHSSPTLSHDDDPTIQQPPELPHEPKPANMKKPHKPLQPTTMTMTTTTTTTTTQDPTPLRNCSNVSS